jgi:hypothetical protein
MSIIKLNKDTYFSTEDGIIVSKEKALDILKKSIYRDGSFTVRENVNKIKGLDSKEIGLKLSTRDGNLPFNRGVLIEVYLSGTDGKLTRLYQTETVDPLSNASLRESFERYIHLDID